VSEGVFFEVDLRIKNFLPLLSHEGRSDGRDPPELGARWFPTVRISSLSFAEKPCIAGIQKTIRKGANLPHPFVSQKYRPDLSENRDNSVIDDNYKKRY